MRKKTSFSLVGWLLFVGGLAFFVSGNFVFYEYSGSVWWNAILFLPILSFFFFVYGRDSEVKRCGA